VRPAAPPCLRRALLAYCQSARPAPARSRRRCPTKLAVLADIHANLAALQAVLDDLEHWSPDRVVVAGDIVNRGPQSDGCLELVLQLAAERGWLLLRGNHERYVLQYDRDRLRPEFADDPARRAIAAPVAWAHAQVAGRLDAIAALREQLRLDLGGETLAFYHASLRHDRDGITRASDDAELREQVDPSTTLFCVGHTHVPLVRRLDRTLVVNAGSVGLPFDHDTRAAYARLTRVADGWHAEIVRLPYDLAATLRAFETTGTLEAVRGQAPLMLRELETGRSLIYDFVPRYFERIRAGEISMEAAVHDYLRGVDGSGGQGWP
jgi:predicted phosphodiesterase